MNKKWKGREGNLRKKRDGMRVIGRSVFTLQEITRRRAQASRMDKTAKRSKNKVNVLFFATLKEKAGTASGVLELPEGTNVATFKQLLFQRFPNLPRHTSSLLVA